MYPILKKVEAFIEKYHMISRQDHIVAGVSGGADSMCLLFVLMNLQKELELGLCVVHVHHGIRGAEADRDERFVREFCMAHELPYRCVRGNVPLMAKEKGMSEEEASLVLTDSSRIHKRGSGVGLVNVNRRRQIYFGNEYGLSIESELDEGTRVLIRIPAVPYTEEGTTLLEEGRLE